MESIDSLSRVSEKVPDWMHLNSFVTCRMDEVLMLTEAIKESPFKGQIFQRLPKHMRRRQMSHYIKRLPKKYQSAQALSLKDGLPPIPKRPSRKYRRRPGNLLQEYNRRQRKNVWLETHIWHAKRFHMTTKWGYKLAKRPVNKGVRANYRATSNHCFIVDISYYNCIELKGNDVTIQDYLRRCTSTDCGLTFAAKVYGSGTREGSVMLYSPDSYPYRAIGTVSFLWKPFGPGEANRVLWLWMHPTIHDEVVNCLKTLFEIQETLNGNKENENEMEAETVLDEVPAVITDTKNEVESAENSSDIKKKKEKKKKIKKTEAMKLEPKNVPYNRTPKFKNEQLQVEIILLKDTLNRFRLVGPLAQSVISQSFTFCEKIDDEVVVCTESSSRKRKIQILMDEEVPTKKSKVVSVEEQKENSISDEAEDLWWSTFYQQKTEKDQFLKQRQYYYNMQNFASAADVTSNCVLSLVIKDPRASYPVKRIKSVQKVEGHQKVQGVLEYDADLSESPIWDPAIRDYVSNNKFTTAEINDAKSKMIVPGELNGLINGKPQSQIPLLLIQRTGLRDSQARLGFGSGWDIIVPANWGMPVWLALIFRGARAGGLEDLQSFDLESSNLKTMQPDTISGEYQNCSQSQERRDSYFKQPPNKRPNYHKMGIPSPFYYPWKVLVADWFPEKTPSSKFYVLRDKFKLMRLDALFASLKRKEKVDMREFADKSFACSLVKIGIECFEKGTPKENSLLCLPIPEDFENFKNNKTAPAEPIHEDPNKQQRDHLRQEHQVKLLKEKRKRRKARLEEIEKINDQPLGEKVPTAPKNMKHCEVDKDYTKKVERLWVELPENITNVRKAGCRETLGFVVQGAFTFSKACGTGLGYVTTAGLLLLLKNCTEAQVEPVLLFRNTNNLQYRFARLRIIID